MSSAAGLSIKDWNTAPGRHLRLQDAVAGGHHVLKLTGELDMASAPELEAAIVRACASTAHAITLDLSALTFVDSSGLAAIASAGEQCSEAGYPLHLIPGPPAVHRVFELTGLLDSFVFDGADGSPAAAAAS
jgi:anti-sigma B factor antagonist